MDTMIEHEPTAHEPEVEATPEDLEVAEVEKLTVPEQRWLDDLEHRAKEWKRSTSEQPYSAQAAIRKLHLDDFTAEDIELWRVFRSLQKSPASRYFQQRFGTLLRARQHATRGDVHSTSYQFTKVLDALHEVADDA